MCVCVGTELWANLAAPPPPRHLARPPVLEILDSQETRGAILATRGSPVAIRGANRGSRLAVRDSRRDSRGPPVFYGERGARARLPRRVFWLARGGPQLWDRCGARGWPPGRPRYSRATTG